MTTELAVGWRNIDLGFSAGQDFLGLAAPIENILDAETSGITNTTARARYFSIVPWYYWKYTQIAGEGSAKDQRQFAIGFETLLAYANIAWLERTNTAMSGILRWDSCSARWKEPGASLPLRGDGVSDTPSPLDAVNYGPSLRRLNLLGKHGQVNTCRRLGQTIAEELDITLRELPNCTDLIHAQSIDRTTVHAWADSLSLACPTQNEITFLRALLFGIDEADDPGIPPRVYTLLLLLKFALLNESSFSASDIETALITGTSSNNTPFITDAVLSDTHSRWRILALLKFLRHASELAFLAVHTHIQLAAMTFGSAEAAAVDLIEQTMSPLGGDTAFPEQFAQLVEQYAQSSPPGWNPHDRRSTIVLRHALAIASWCHAFLRSHDGRQLLKNELVRVGQSADADLRSYSGQLDALYDQPTRRALRWLLVDRAIARHFQVAARKLVQHDTFRLIEDEEVVRATQKCAVAAVAMRLDAMLSLLSDLRLLERNEYGYRKSIGTESWYRQQLLRLQS